MIKQLKLDTITTLAIFPTLINMKTIKTLALKSQTNEP